MVQADADADSAPFSAPAQTSYQDTTHAEHATSLSTSAWKLAPQPDVKEAGEAISTPGYASDSWVNAQVPGTAFGSYVIAGIEKEPSVADNAREVDLKKYDQNFWYRTEFTVPADYREGGKVWLNLDGVNRDADVFVNGAKVGSLHGFFQRGRFDITDLLHKQGINGLAVLAYVPALSEDKHAGNSSSPSESAAVGGIGCRAFPA